jgi:putative oxidoreductase
MPRLAPLVLTPPALTDLGLLLLRASFGGLMALGHGLGKLSADASKFPDPLGIGNAASLYGAVFSELVCGLLLVLGLLTRLACLPLIFAMLVAAFVIHAADPFFLPGPRTKEPAVIYALAFACVLILGPGRFSLDHALFGRR